MIANIQILRAFAALAVVLHHLQFWLSDAYGTPHFALVGRAGVDLFFVISGFIMVYTNRDGARTTAEFWIDRGIRIVPLYWIGTTLVIVLFLAGLEPLQLRNIGAGDMVASYLFLPNIDEYGAPRPVLDVGWTLNYEMYFYALFGLLLFVRSQARQLMILAAAFAAIWLTAQLVPALPFAITHYGNALVFEFLIGGVMALWYQQGQRSEQRNRPLLGAALVVTSLALLIAAGWQFANAVNDEPELRVVVFGGPSVLMLAGALLLERSGWRVKSRTLLLLGAASYAIYLVHPLVLQASVPFFAASIDDQGLPQKVGAIVFGFTASVIVGVLVHLWLERPMTAWLRSRLKRNMRAVAIA
jgi:peptidoglycan/LPS O-acetylase OafA/YrhL